MAPRSQAVRALTAARASDRTWSDLAARPPVVQHLPLRYQISKRRKSYLIAAAPNRFVVPVVRGQSAIRISAGQRRRELVVLAKTVLLSGRDGSHAVCMRTQASRHQRRSCSEPGCPTGQRAARARLVACPRPIKGTRGDRFYAGYHVTLACLLTHYRYEIAPARQRRR